MTRKLLDKNPLNRKCKAEVITEEWESILKDEVD